MSDDGWLYELYHENSKYLPLNKHVISEREFISFLKNKHSSIPLSYEYIVPLIDKDSDSDLSYDSGALKESSNGLSLKFLSELLSNSYGFRRNNANQEKLRPVISPFGIYPIEIYLVSMDHKKIANGLYHYNVDEHGLEFLKTCTEKDITQLMENSLTEEPKIIFFITGVLHDMTEYFGEKAYQHLLKESGKISQIMYQHCQHKLIKYEEILFFYDHNIEKFLEIDGVDHILLALNIIVEKYPL